MDLLLPDRLKELWRRVERAGMTREAFAAEQTRLLDACRAVWIDALRLGTHETLEESLVAELGAYVGCDDLDEVRARCRRAVADLKREWEDGEARADRPDAVARFYDRSAVTLYELTWWHTLTDDLSPLSYVLALQFATRHDGRAYLDFGAGVGSGAILFARHGFDVTVADIASPLRTYTRWRLGRRGLKADERDLRTTSLPRERFDFITAMDVFEHLVDPVGTAEHIWDALRPGGFLYGRFGCEPDDSHPMHIVEDFEPTLARLRELGGVEVWRDEWLWGHQVFRKPPAPGAGAP